MAFYSQICALCSQAFLNYELRKVDKDFTNFINSFIHDGDATLFLMICNICSNNLKQFKLFIEKSKRSLKRFELLRQWQENKEYQVCHENSIEIVLHESKNTMEQICSPEKIENTITITKLTMDEAQNKSSFEAEKDFGNICGNSTRHQVAPLDLTINTASKDSELNNNDLPVPTQDRKQQHGSPLFNEKKKMRNREASRRYRERARKDPKLLLRMREQQKKRQKKYYDKMRKYEKRMNEKITFGPLNLENKQNLGWCVGG